MRTLAQSTISQHPRFSKEQVVWWGAYSVFAIVGVVALYASYKATQRGMSIVLPIGGMPLFFMPMFIGRQARKRLVTAGESAIRADVREEISSFIALLTILAYGILEFGIILGLFSRGIHPG
jgi:hypothetical protein